MKQETIDLIVQLRDSGKSWFDVHKEVPHISPEQVRRIYRETKGLNKSQSQIGLRDYLAGKALNGVIHTFYDALTQDGESCDFSYKDGEPNSVCFCVAESAYAIADAMMESRTL